MSSTDTPTTRADKRPALSASDALDLMASAIGYVKGAGLSCMIGNRDDSRAVLIVIEGAMLAESGELVPMQ